MPLFCLKEGEYMALLNGLYVHAISETIENSYNKTNNPVEEGVDVTDHIERNLVKLKLEGELIDTPTLTAGKMYSQLQLWANKGTIIQFRGRNVFDGVITNISKTSTAEISNGAEVTIDFEEMKVATSLYTEPKANAGTQQVQSTKNTGKNVYHIVQKGEWLLKIARKYNTTLEWILAHNKLKSGNPNLIYPGEKLLVSTNGVPNTATASTSKTNTNKTNANTNKTNVQTAKTVATTHIASSGTEHGGGRSFVVTEESKKIDISKLTLPTDNYGAKLVAKESLTFTVSNKIVEEINDKISRMKVYISYFRKKYTEWSGMFGENADYTKYVNWLEYDLSVIEKNLKNKKYTSGVAGYIKVNSKDALDKCDKAKVALDESITKYHQANTTAKSTANKVVPYLYNANLLSSKFMNSTGNLNSYNEIMNTAWK